MTRVRTAIAVIVLTFAAPAVLVAGTILGGGGTGAATPHAPNPVPSAEPQTSTVATPEPLLRASRSVRIAPTWLPAPRPSLAPAAIRHGGPSALPAPPVRVALTPTRTGGRSYTIQVAVADCEGGERLANGRAVHWSYKLRAADPNSSASGKFSFLDSTWEWVTGTPAPASAYSEAVQDAAFRKLWDGGRGASHWNASRSCWGWFG